MNNPNSFTGDGGGALWQSPQDLVGTVLADRYEVKKVLGDGGMGSVYLGEHMTLRKRVAIKVLHQELCRDQTQVDRFLQEARAASMIGHENIVDIVDFGPVPGGSVFFAMEYLEGEDLSHTLKREGRFSWSRAQPLMLQILRALRAAHDKGIIHRDLKPANCFLVRRSDGRDFVKLLDFGIAKVTDPESGDGGGLTRTGAVFGTAKYMAPEQACGDPADQRTDIYAAAVCLYEFLTGQVPYDGDNFMRVLSRHLTEPLTLPSTMCPDASITPAVEALIVKALSKKPDDRYQNMAEFEQAILAIGPDGNLRNQVYEGPPKLATPPATPRTQFAPPSDAPGGTMWLQDAQAQGGPAPGSQPPAGRGGTMLLDPNDPRAAEEIYGTVKLAQNWDQSRPPPQVADHPESTVMMQGMGQEHLPSGPVGSAITNSPPIGGPVSQSIPPAGAPHPATAPPAPGTVAPDATMFATEQRSKGKMAMLLGLGALIAIGGGGLVAWALTGADDDADDDPIVVTNAPDEPKAPEPEPKPDPEPEPIIEIPEPDPEPHDSGGGGEPEPDDSGGGGGEAEPVPSPDPKPDKKPESKPRSRPNVKNALSSGDLSKGFRRAAKKASACQGWIPGMTIKVSATINSEGRVISAKPLNNAGLPVAKCVANAVKSSARFPKTKKPLDVQSWTYKK